MNTEQLLWWGYKHVQGTYQAKRYLGTATDFEILDAIDSDFVETIVPVFEAVNRDQALAYIKSETE